MAKDKKNTVSDEQLRLLKKQKQEKTLPNVTVNK